MFDTGAVTSTLLAIARDVGDERALAALICQACIDGLDVDGAALSLLTAEVAGHTCTPPMTSPGCWRSCSSP